jgi:GNAT superfamily N-acetyltransferase
MIARPMHAVADIEDALVAHWSLFGRWPGATLHEKDGLLFYETPIAHLPYNGVVRTRLREGKSADRAVAATLRRFERRGVTPIWFDHPTATPADLGKRLAAHGLRPVAGVTGMSLELDGWTAPPLPPGIEYREVADDVSIAVYTELTVAYWEIPEKDRPLVAQLHRHWGRSVGRRFLAFADGEAVGKGYVSLAGPAGVAAIFGMSVLPSMRGGGVGAGMVTTLLQAARESGRRRVVLHSSELAVPLYRRAGFVARCPLTVYSSAPLWTHHGGTSDAREGAITSR